MPAQIDGGSVTIKGRLMWLKATAEEAFEFSKTGKFPKKDVGDAQPHFNLLLNDTEYEKVVKWATEEFLPSCVESWNMHKEKGRNALEQDDVDLILAEIAKPSKRSAVITPFKEIKEGLADQVDETHMVKVVGTKGGKFIIKAIVRNQDEINDPDGDLLYTKDVPLPIKQTVHELYDGCNVIVRVTGYAYNAAKPGFSLSTDTITFKSDNTPILGGGGTSDDDIMAADD